MDGQKAVILAQVGHFYFGAVGQFCIGGDIYDTKKVAATAIELFRGDVVLEPDGALDSDAVVKPDPV